MRNAGLDETQSGIKIAGRNINNHRYAYDTNLWQESEEELKSLLMKVKEESEKAGLKLNIQKTKIMASSPITSWQIDGKTMEIVTDFIFLDSKITADGDCSHGMKRRLLLGRKVMTNLNSILKSRDITFLTKVCLVKAMVFPVVVYGCESWTIKKTEHQRINAFELWCWRGLLRVPWTATRSNQALGRFSLQTQGQEISVLVLTQNGGVRSVNLSFHQQAMSQEKSIHLRIHVLFKLLNSLPCIQNCVDSHE